MTTPHYHPSTQGADLPSSGRYAVVAGPHLAHRGSLLAVGETADQAARRALDAHPSLNLDDCRWVIAGRGERIRPAVGPDGRVVALAVAGP